MKVKELIEKLKLLDPELDVVAGADEDDDVISVYETNVWKGKGNPVRKCVWIDTQKEDE